MNRLLRIVFNHEHTMRQDLHVFFFATYRTIEQNDADTVDFQRETPLMLPSIKRCFRIVFDPENKIDNETSC